MTVSLSTGGSLRVCGTGCAFRYEQDGTGFGGKAPTVLGGEIGTFAKAVGASSLAFHSRFMVEPVGLAQT